MSACKEDGNKRLERLSGKEGSKNDAPKANILKRNENEREESEKKEMNKRW